MFMVRVSRGAGAALALAVVLAVGAALVIATRGGADSTRAHHNGGGSAVSYSGVAGSNAPAALGRYIEQAPHVASTLQTYGPDSGVQSGSQTPPAAFAAVPAAAFAEPIAAYRAFSSRQLVLMQDQVSLIQAALAADDRAAAQRAWRQAFSDYLKLGAVYLVGRLAGLDDAIAGTPGGLPGGTASRRFSGLHRLELGLWTGAPLSSLQPWAQRLAADVRTLRGALQRVAISPFDYVTRAHEILEDAIRDLLSGTDVPWSGEGVLGTDAAVAATAEVIHTLAPLLSDREGTLPVVLQELTDLRATLRSIKLAHGGTLPTNEQLTQLQSERLDGSVGQAAEALAQVPVVIETNPKAQIPGSSQPAARVSR